MGLGTGRTVAVALAAGGCTVRIHNRLLAALVGRIGRNHRKVLLIDDEVAFLGGSNIGDENVGDGTRLGWADVALDIRGQHCRALGHMIRREPQPTLDRSLQIFLSGLGGGWRLRRRYLQASAGARHRIHVAHGYFLPDKGVVRAITAAAARGVDVRLLLAGRSDILFARAASRSLYRHLLRSGVRIHEWNDSVLHPKVATVDGRRLLLGSFNIDPFSMANLETLVQVDDPCVVAQADAWILGVRGETRRGSSRRGFRSWVGAETPLYRVYCKFWRHRQERKGRVRCRVGFHHGLLERFATCREMTSVEANSWVARRLLEPFGRAVARLADASSRLIASRRQRSDAPDRSTELEEDE